MINGLALAYALTFHKWILVFLVCLVLSGGIIFKLLDRLGKETDSVILKRRKRLFYISYALFTLAIYALMRDLHVFEAIADSYHAALDKMK